MADETLEQTPDDSIASALASAIAQHETPAADPTKALEAKATAEKPVEAKPEPEKADTKEAPAEGKDSKSETGEPEAASGERDDKTEASETKSDKDPSVITTWSTKDKELFRKQSPEVKEFLTRRYTEMQNGLNKKMNEFKDLKTEYDPVNKLFEPYRERMRAGGWTPYKLIEAWSTVEKRLMEGDAVNVIAGLATAYKVNLGDVAKTLGLRPRPQTNGAAEPNGAPPAEPQGQSEIQLPPQVARQLEAIQARLDAEDRARADTARRQMTASETRVMNEIDQFKSAQDDRGNALYPHFDEVEEAMVLLAQSANAAKKPMALKDLYETAVWANPKLREETLAARDRAQQEKAAGEARAKAAQARKAGSSVTGAPGPGGQATNSARKSNRSLREELDEAFASQQTGGRI
jgi:hypothetical protein